MDFFVAAAGGTESAEAWGPRRGTTPSLKQQQVGTDARAADVRRDGPARVAQLPAKKWRPDAGAAGSRAHGLPVEADPLLQLGRPAADVGDRNATMLRRTHLGRQAREDEQLDEDFLHVVVQQRRCLDPHALRHRLHQILQLADDHRPM